MLLLRMVTHAPLPPHGGGLGRRLLPAACWPQQQLPLRTLMRAEPFWFGRTCRSRADDDGFCSAIRDLVRNKNRLEAARDRCLNVVGGTGGCDSLGQGLQMGEPLITLMDEVGSCGLLALLVLSDEVCGVVVMIVRLFGSTKCTCRCLGLNIAGREIFSLPPSRTIKLCHATSTCVTERTPF